MKEPVLRSIAETLRQSLGVLTPTERKSALVLLANYPIAGLETTAQFAKRAAVSSPTILRLVSKLGFASYLDFQQALRDELELRLQPPLAKAGKSRKTDDSQRDFISDYGDVIIGNIRQSLREVSRADFKEAIALLSDSSRRVSLLGGRFTASLALHFYQHLRELRPKVQLIGGQTATWVEHLLDFSRKDVLIVFDIRRYQDDVVHFARQASALGCTVILFTDHWLSPIAAVARHVFALQTGMPSNWESFAALSALTETMIASLHEATWEDVERRMGKLEELRRKLSPE